MSIRMVPAGRRVAGLACAALIALIAVLTPASVRAADEIGKISRIQAVAQAETGGVLRELALDTPIHLNDIVTTGNEARLEIILIDGSQITVGAQARLVIDGFVYQPTQVRAQLAASVKGAFRFISGGIGRTVGNRIAVRTPFAIIGVRGTDFWAGPVDGISGVVLFEGAVTVSGAGSQVTLDRPGQGTNVTAAGQPPGTVTTWPQDKVDRALAQVAFQ